MDLVEVGGRLPAVGVGLEELAAQTPRLGGQALACELTASAVRIGVGRLLPHEPGRDREHGDPAPAERPPGEGIGVTPAVGEQAERHVDPDDSRQRQSVQRRSHPGARRRGGGRVPRGRERDRDPPADACVQPGYTFARHGSSVATRTSYLPPPSMPMIVCTPTWTTSSLSSTLVSLSSTLVSLPSTLVSLSS